MTPTISLAYRKAALQQASTVGLVIALYDTLQGCLSRAATAMDRNDIEIRCKELIHGFRVLQQLDSMIDMDNGGPAAINLRRFYTHIRGQMLKAQFKLSPAILHQQINALIDVRGAWHQVDARGTQTEQAIQPHRTHHEEVRTKMHQPVAEPEIKHVSFSCSG
jgi:flagellar biosynthetic protein FliS